MAILVITMLSILVYLPEWQGGSLPDSTPELEIQKAKQINDYRATIAQILGGFALIIGIYLTWRRIVAVEKTVEITGEGQITERFTRAIEQLGDDRLTIRLGGIYALERIARDSKRDRRTVMAVLAAFVRENRPLVAEEDRSTEVEWLSLPTDIQAILTVIGQYEHEASGDYRLDLKCVDLRGADFRNLHFEYANFHRSDLSYSSFEGSYFRRANLSDAIMVKAMIVGAHLDGAFLIEADLSHSIILNSKFKGADLRKAKLDGVCCEEEDLLLMSGLSRKQREQMKIGGALELFKGVEKLMDEE